jgi:hypothetical protein
MRRTIYPFPGSDVPVAAAGQVITPAFRVIGAQPEELPETGGRFLTVATAQLALAQARPRSALTLERHSSDNTTIQ